MVKHDLLKDLRVKDRDGYSELYEKYSWELHNYLRNKIDDKKVADEAFSKAMIGFCELVDKCKTGDAWEVILHLYADNICMQLQKDQSVDFLLPIDESNDEPLDSNEPIKGRAQIAHIILIVLMAILLLAVIWFALGKTVQMELIPGFQLDLGYRWFDQNVFPWFS